MTMNEILLAREARSEKQKALLEKHSGTLLCFSMNVPGADKNGTLIDLAFRAGCDQLRILSGGFLYEETERTAAGPQGFYLLKQSPEEAKALARMIEEGNPVGRLYDMDVFEDDGTKRSREVPRTCLLCDRPAAECAKSGAHTVEEARTAADRLLKEFAADQLAKAAQWALVQEVNLTPKPGLVDKAGNGAHSDMNVLVFEKSANALLPYFRRSVLLGMESEACMRELQAAGVEAEKAMFEATGGVNTHKGAIYAFGLLLAAMGSKLAFDSELFSTAAALASEGMVTREDTHGNQVRKKYPRCGPRQEALEGFPNAISAYNILCETGEPLRALTWLIASVPDTNLLYRGGAEGLLFAQEEAKKALSLPEKELRSALIRMDQSFTEKNLSPGGSADLLALALFLQKTESVWSDE